MGLWQVDGDLVGKSGKASANISGIACTSDADFPRSCAVIDDELQDAQLVILEENRLVAGDSIPLVTGSFADKPLPLDGEGVAYADGFFYFIGSHGHPRDRKHKLDPIKHAAEIEAKILACSKIIRCPSGTVADMKARLEVSQVLRALIKSDPVLKDFADKRLDENGVTIEGVAVRAGCLYAGFRGPVLTDGKAVVLSASVASLFDGAPLNPNLHRLDLSGRGVRDLAPWMNGLLVLAGPSGGEEGTYSVFFWDVLGDVVTALGDLPSVTNEEREQVKAEAILPLGGQDDGLRVLVFFDGAEEGGPHDFVVSAPP